jgi:hypothetical protein
MEFKKGSIVVTKDGEYILKNLMTVYNPFNLQPVTMFIVDDNGVEKSVSEDKVLGVKNNQIENIEEP